MKDFSQLYIAIHSQGRWNRKWIDYCDANCIPHKIVNCYDSDILKQVKGCSGLMWAFNHLLPSDILMARHVLYAAARAGLKVYPDFHSSWHFDDKIAQKYLFDALDIPAVNSWVFYSKEQANVWIEENGARFPIVTKLRRGAGSYNVRLLETPNDGRSFVKRMFGRGYSPSPSGMADVRSKLRVAYALGGVGGVRDRLKKAPNFFRRMKLGRRFHSVEKGYAYFQEYVQGNECDYRVKVVGDRAWGFRRLVRPNDFRASGSGLLDFDHEKIPMTMIETAFSANNKLRMQSVGFDFVLNQGNPEIIETSFGFTGSEGESTGYWTADGVRHPDSFDPLDFIIENFISNHPRP